jgi:predicted DNA-binding transcriptional regulator YafY
MSGPGTTLRHWVMLRAVPRLPRKLTAAELKQHLADEGFDVSKRTVERDLVNLSTVFSLVCDEAASGSGWSWTREAPAFDVPGMDPEAALTLAIVERFARDLLPRSALHRLAPQFKTAAGILEQLPEGAGPRVWPARVRTLSRSLELQPPEVSEAVIEAVYRALLEGRQLRGEYRPRTHGGAPQTYDVIHPLGLVFRDQVAYLVATLWNYADVRQLALHRFASAEVLDEERAEPNGFDLDRYIEEGHFHIRESGDLLHLRVRLDRAAAYHLQETPLTNDQVVTELDDGQLELAASVRDTLQLRWWLLGFGSAAEVVAPETCRE